MQHEQHDECHDCGCCGALPEGLLRLLALSVKDQCHEAQGNPHLPSAGEVAANIVSGKSKGLTVRVASLPGDAAGIQLKLEQAIDWLMGMSAALDMEIALAAQRGAEKADDRILRPCHTGGMTAMDATNSPNAQAIAAILSGTVQGMTCAEITQEMPAKTSPQTVHAQLQGLVAGGLAEKDEKKRYRLTEQGQAAAKQPGAVAGGSDRQNRPFKPAALQPLVDELQQRRAEAVSAETEDESEGDASDIILAEMAALAQRRKITQERIGTLRIIAEAMHSEAPNAAQFLADLAADLT